MTRIVARADDGTETDITDLFPRVVDDLNEYFAAREWEEAKRREEEQHALRAEFERVTADRRDIEFRQWLQEREQA